MSDIERSTYTPFFHGLISDVVSVPVGDGKKLLFLSGVGDCDPNGSIFNPDSPVVNKEFDAQLRAIFGRIEEILHHHDAKIANIVKMVVYVTDSRFFPQQVGAILKDVFSDGVVPVSTGVVVGGLAYPDMLVEVDVIAVTG